MVANVLAHDQTAEPLRRHLARRIATGTVCVSTLAAGLVAALLALSPSAVADACTLTVTLTSGRQVAVSVNVPAGTPLSSIPLPITLGVVSVSESCPAAAGPPVSLTVSKAPTATAKPLPPAVSPRPVAGKPHAGRHRSPTPTAVVAQTRTSQPRAVKHHARGAVNGAELNFALPSAGSQDVPNFFIHNFQIPPFLLPIYQAAGIEYDVPWQVLAAVNWIETDYGRDLNVSSAGAVGWMQFLPSTWKQWGVDATGSGYADPYNPADAIFTAARYLQAAGAARNLPRAIYAYNHAAWYVESVLLRAQLIGGIPSGLIGALSTLVEDQFPVAAAAHYSDDGLATAIFAKAGSPVIAVNDGKIIAIGDTAELGRYIKLQDDAGNTYTYSHLGLIPSSYPVPKAVAESAAQLRKELSFAGVGSHGAAKTILTAPASAGVQSRRSTLLASVFKSTSAIATGLQRLPAGARTRATKRRAAANAPTGLGKQRLFANPSLPASYAAGGQQQLASEAASVSNFQHYFADALHLARNQYTLAPLAKGSIVVAGTILGRIGAGTARDASHLWFQIQPAGQKSPFIDPKPILDGWKLLEATAVYRAAGINPFFGPGVKQASIGEVLLESKQQLAARVLADPHVAIYRCGRRDIQAGLIDRRILATIEFLSASGLHPTISGLACDAGNNGIDRAGASGASMDISAINGIPILGHQGSGSITDVTIRRLLTLQGFMAPTEIISLMSYRGESNTLSLPDHANRIQVAYTPSLGADRKLAGEVRSILKPAQWIQLIQHIGHIAEPTVPIGRSVYAIRTSVTG
jgi:hypothetical protein